MRKVCPRIIKVSNFPGGTSRTILENLDQLIKSKPDCLIDYAGTNNLVNGTVLHNQVKKIVKQVKKFSKIPKLYFRAV